MQQKQQEKKQCKVYIQQSCSRSSVSTNRPNAKSVQIHGISQNICRQAEELKLKRNEGEIKCQWQRKQAMGDRTKILITLIIVMQR